VAADIDMPAENRKTAFKELGIGAESVENGKQYCHQKTLG
jgi:hypothetical protein